MTLQDAKALAESLLPCSCPQPTSTLHSGLGYTLHVAGCLASKRLALAAALRARDEAVREGAIEECREVARMTCERVVVRDFDFEGGGLARVAFDSIWPEEVRALKSQRPARGEEPK